MMIGAELFRQGPRPRAMSIAGLTNWLFTAVVALSFELVQVIHRQNYRPAPCGLRGCKTIIPAPFLARMS